MYEIRKYVNIKYINLHIFYRFNLVCALSVCFWKISINFINEYRYDESTKSNKLNLQPHYLTCMHFSPRKIIVSNAPPVRLRKTSLQRKDKYCCDISAGGYYILQVIEPGWSGGIMLTSLHTFRGSNSITSVSKDGSVWTYEGSIGEPSNLLALPVDRKINRYIFNYFYISPYCLEAFYLSTVVLILI